MPRLAQIVFIALLLIATGTSRSAPARFAGPGPTVISPEETAVKPDPAQHMEEAVVLLREIEARDFYGKASADFGRDTRVHQRIKVFSGQARVGIQVFYVPDVEGIVEWWARAIHPDGTVVELPKGAMSVVHDELEGPSYELRVTNAPPGSIVDLGYTMRQRGYSRAAQRFWVALRYPTRRFHLRWLTRRGLSHTILRAGLDPFPVDVQTNGPDLEAVGRDISAAESLAELGANPSLWLVTLEETPTEHWKRVSREEDAGNTAFLQYDTVLDQVIKDLHLADTATVDEKLRAAYAFVEKNIRVAGLETDDARREEGDAARRPAGIVRNGRAWAPDIPRLLLGLARRMGVEATTLLVWSMRWDAGTAIFVSPSARLVAFKPSSDPQAAWVALAPGFGLPYGLIPHSFAGTRGLLGRKDGIEVVELPPSMGPSTSSIRGTVGLSSDLKDLHLEWTWSGTGQEGLMTRRWLQSLDDDRREVAFARKCAEIVAEKGLMEFDDLLDQKRTEGSSPTLFNRSTPFELRCTARIPAPPWREEGKAWGFPAAPNRDLAIDLHDDPVVRRSLFQLAYPVEHVSVIEVRAPEGFTAAEPPEVVRIDAPCCGSYVRTVTRTDTGFRVERKLTLPRRKIAASQAEALNDFVDRVREADGKTVGFVKAGQHP